MAINTREAVRTAIKIRANYVNEYISRLTSLFHNSVIMENEDELPKRYLLRVLLNRGGIAYDKETKLYLPFTAGGIDVYGLPKYYILIGYNGYVIQRKPNEVVILRANDIQYPQALYFEQQSHKLVNLDLSIEQNLEAVKTMTVAEVSDHETLLSMANEVEARRVGATVIYKNKKSSFGNEIKVQSTGAIYLVDKLLEARKQIYNETLSTIGINVANVDKRERVQGEEIRASEGYALDSINTLINTFNYDAKKGNLKIRLVGNTSLILNNKLDTLERETEIKSKEQDDENISSKSINQ